MPDVLALHTDHYPPEKPIVVLSGHSMVFFDDTSRIRRKTRDGGSQRAQINIVATIGGQYPYSVSQTGGEKNREIDTVAAVGSDANGGGWDGDRGWV